MSKGIIETVGGSLAIAGGVAESLFLGPAGVAVGKFLIEAGAGLVISGIGTMIAGTRDRGFSTAERNPIAPWQVVPGTAEVGGTVVYISSFGTNSVGTPNAWLDMVIVVAAHLSYSVD